MSWFSFWHPKKSAALEAEERQNREIMKSNQSQNDKDRKLSTLLSLLEFEDSKNKNNLIMEYEDSIVIIVLVLAFLLIYYLKNKK